MVYTTSRRGELCGLGRKIEGGQLGNNSEQTTTTCCTAQEKKGSRRDLFSSELDEAVDENLSERFAQLPLTEWLLWHTEQAGNDASSDDRLQ